MAKTAMISKVKPRPPALGTTNAQGATDSLTLYRFGKRSAPQWPHRPPGKSLNAEPISATSMSERHRFADLKDVLAKASHRRSGDELAGLAAATDAQRVAARAVLADLPLSTFLNEPIIPYETDEVTRLILDSHDAPRFAAICPSDRRRLSRLAAVL